MEYLDDANRREVVCSYLLSEPSRLELGNSAEAICEGDDENAIQCLAHKLICDVRNHSWLYEQFYQKGLFWSLASLCIDEIDVMPMGGNARDFHYPKLSKFVDEVKCAAEKKESIPGVNDTPEKLLDVSRQIENPRIIVVKGKYAERCFDFAIADGAHRAISLASVIGTWS